MSIVPCSTPRFGHGRRYPTRHGVEGILLGKQYEAEKKRSGALQAESDSEECAHPEHIPPPNQTSNRIVAETGVGHAAVRRADKFARDVDTLAADSPTIKGKILSKEIAEYRTRIFEIAAQPGAERVKSVVRMERGDSPEPEI